ncbi:hypothetical protein CEXT_450451 [Caerostris extrusa]|uniref:Uncharacterized protein n=1 Tax=Caerostris extrusa TaxID=172846 RepID=A0AAV4NPX0_CAEEX|nr:hypothetical protein CEXT_450451 [Caerostris extrusa]
MVKQKNGERERERERRERERERERRERKKTSVLYGQASDGVRSHGLREDCDLRTQHREDAHACIGSSQVQGHLQ